MVGGSEDAPRAVLSPCRTGQRATAEAAAGPGAGTKEACTGGKLAPPWHGGTHMEGVGLILPCRFQGEGPG